MAISLSAVIITYNEERNIERCLASLVGIADEIIVVDSFSSDKTEAICSAFRAKFIQNKFEGHIQQKNFAISCATFDWILSLDADEALTDELKKSILKVKENADFTGFQMNRLTNYCGKWVKHCGWYPDTKIRLVHRNFASWTGVNPHDRLEMKNGEEIGHLQGDLLHYSYYSKQDHLKQIEYFGNIASKELFNQGIKSNWFKITYKVVAQFFKSYFLKLGILDGGTGFTISRLSAYATYVKYHKLLLLSRK
jgi:glycosyltransferase involved in cell wall biosynthesis